MINRKMTSIGFGICLMMLAVGCVRSTQPILLDSQVIADNSLVGKWVGTDKQNPQTIVVGAPDKDNLCNVVYTSSDSKGEHPITVLARVGKIGDRLIAELRPAPPADGAADASPLVMPVYCFVVVEKADDQLQLSLLDPDWTKNYIKSHPGELQIVSVKTDDLILNMPTDALQAFLKQHLGDDGAMGKPGVFVREAAAAK